MNLIDFNTLTSDPIKNLNAARVALRKTEFGRTGIVRAEFADDNRSVLFRLITTGKTYTSYEQALDDASASMVTRFTTALPYNRAASLMDPNNPKISQVGDVLFSIQQNMRKDDFKLHEQNLERLGLSKTIIDDIRSKTRSLAIDLFQIKDQEEVRAKALDEIRRQIKREGNKNLLPFIDDEGGNLLRFKVTKAAGEVDDLVLTNAQVHYLLAAAGQPLLEPGMLDEVIAGKKSAQSLLQKLGKRMKGIFGERDLTIFAEDILGEFSGGKGTVDDTILVIEEGLDYLRKTVGIDARSSAVGLALENVDTNQSIKRSLERMGKADPKTFIEELFAEGTEARQILTTAENNEKLLERLKGVVSEDQFSSIDKLMKDVAQDFDGISALNIRTLKSARKRISAQLKLVMDQAERNPNDLQIQEQYAALRSQLDRINNADNLYQLTGRGLIGEGQVKTAFYVDKFSGELDNYSMILGRSATKGELGITGMSRFITLSGLGSPKDLVYADPGLIAFHPELFATEQGVKAMQEYSASVIQDFQQSINQNILPQNVVTSLRKELETDITGLPEPVRLSKEKNRRFIQEILELHQSGIGPRQSPEMMNLLANVYASRAFREETGKYGRMFLPVLPDTYRFAVSTESAAAISNKSFTPMLGSGTQTTSFKISNERALKNIGATKADLTAKFDPSGTIMSQELLKFRIDNHRVLFAAGAVPEYFSALGGFDLDDKGLPRLMTYTDSQNRKRLMFSLTRQPTGAQETILARATLADTETLRNLYGDRDDFRKALRSLVSEGAGEDFNVLERTLAGESKLASMVGVNVDEAEYTMEKTILKVYEKMGRSIVDVEEDGGRTIYNIAKYGSSGLANTDSKTRAAYSRSGIRQVFAQEQSKAFNLIPFMDAAESSISQLEEVLPTGIADSLRRAMAANDSARFASILNSDSNSPGLNALKQMMFINRLSQGSESTDELGKYINRSMVVGSTLNQFDDFLFEIMGNKAVKDFLTKDGIGLVAQEAAIDASIGFSLQKGFVAELASLTSETLDPDAAMRAVERLTGAAGGVTTLDKLGETAIDLLGQRLGKMSKLYALRETLGLKFDESLRPVIDELILSSRLSSSDRPKLLQGVITGLEQGQTTFGEDAETTNLLTRLKRVATQKDPEKITESLINIFGTKTGKYAAASTVQRLGETQQLMISEMEKLGLSRIMRDQVLSATQVSEEAMNAAKIIIEKNKDDLTRLIKLKDLDLSNSQLMTLSGNKNLLSKKIISDFDSVKRITGLSTEELINATEKYSSRMGIKFPFDYIMTEDEEAVDFARQVAAARTRRMSRFIGDLSETPAAQNVLDAIQSAKSASEEAYDQSRFLLSEIESGRLTGEEANIAEVILGNQEAMAAMSEDQLEAARRGSQAIFVKQQEAAISSEVSRALTEKPAAATAADTESVVGKTLKMVMDGESYEEAARKAKYKRIGDFIRDGSLKNLFDNKVFRNSVFAAGALIAGSFIYQGSKERTQESIEGPPLLPGGSAYEDYPQRAAQIPQIGTMSYNPGISYKVNLYGNRRDVSNFQQMAMGIGNFDMDTTMYSRIPEVGADPYQQLASSF